MSKPECLRDYFAGLAIEYFLKVTSDRDAVSADMEWEEMVAAQSYMVADAMMKVRDEK